MPRADRFSRLWPPYSPREQKQKHRFRRPAEHYAQTAAEQHRLQCLSVRTFTSHILTAGLCTLTPPLPPYLAGSPPRAVRPNLRSNPHLGQSPSSGMRSAPSQYGPYYGAASAGQTPSSSNPKPPQFPPGTTGGTGAAQVSRAGSRRSLASNRLRAQVQAPAGEARAEAAPGAMPNVVPSPSVSNLTHRVRTSLPGPGSGPGTGGSGASSSPSLDQQGRARSPHLDEEEPARGRRMNGTKDVLDRPGRGSSMVSPAPGSKPISKDPYTRRESMDIPSPNGKSPSYTKTNGVSLLFRTSAAVPPPIDNH
jgi:hypothetical protein